MTFCVTMMQRNATDCHVVVRMVKCRASGYLLQYVFYWYPFLYLSVERQFHLQVNSLATPPRHQIGRKIFTFISLITAFFVCFNRTFSSTVAALYQLYKRRSVPRKLSQRIGWGKLKTILTRVRAGRKS